jgi:hypothetical protein
VNPSILTTLHVDLLLLVLKSHSYDLIADMTFLRAGASKSLLSLAPGSFPIETLDYLQFWLYFGNFHAARKDFVQAQEAYNMVLTIPAQGAVSAIQVEAYKKMILVSLLAQGEVSGECTRAHGDSTCIALHCRSSSHVSHSSPVRVVSSSAVFRCRH